MVKEEKIKIKIPEDIPTYAVSGFFGGLSEREGILKLIEDDVIPAIDEKGNYCIEHFQKKFLANIKLSPKNWKHLAYWMLKHVKEHEKKFGVIQVKNLPISDNNIGYEFVSSD